MPYNLALHEHMLSLGYSHSHHASFLPAGARRREAAWDEYVGPDETVLASEHGVVERLSRDLAFERWIDSMASAAEQEFAEAGVGADPDRPGG